MTICQGDREERLEKALLRIKQWADAYPVRVFRPLTIEDLRHANFALKAIGIDMGALHAEWARHILNGISKICSEAMEEKHERPPDGLVRPTEE